MSPTQISITCISEQFYSVSMIMLMFEKSSLFESKRLCTQEFKHLLQVQQNLNVKFTFVSSRVLILRWSNN